MRKELLMKKTSSNKKNSTKKTSQPASEVRQPQIPSPEAVRDQFHRLLHDIDGSNHSLPKFITIPGCTRACGHECFTEMPRAVGSKSRKRGFFRVFVIFQAERCEVWLLYSDGEELFYPDSPLATYRYDDPRLFDKLFRRLEALNFFVPDDFWKKVTSST
jgi:hypothetical protein